jgi:hypothetical protein
MAFTVEDGTGVADANALVTVEFADSYFADRANAAWSAALEAAKEVAIIKATDYMEILYGERWRGTLSEDATTLSFPRNYFYDKKNNLIDFSEDGIPSDIKKACCEYALRALSAELMPDPEVDSATGKEVTLAREKVGPIETEYEFLAGSTSTKKSYPVADRLLRGWLIDTGGVYR